jgi:hypothetical protein
MQSLGLAAVLLVSALTVFADTLTVTKETSGGRETIRKEYVQGDNSRSEYEEFSGGAPGLQRISIRVGGKVGYQIDPKTREYIEYPIPTPAPARPLSLSTYQSGKTLDIYIEVTDTGERKAFFGQTARHLIWRERSVAEPGACGASSSVRVHDGWYLPEPEKAASQGFAYILAVASADGKICRDRIITHGSRPGGLAVIADDGSFRTEIIELSHEPLDKSLFTVPSGYTKVAELPPPPSRPMPPPTWSQKMEWEWMQLVRELESWFH